MITLSAPPKRSSIAVSRIRIACWSAIAAPVMLVLIVIGTSGTPSRLRIAIGSIEPLSGSSRQMTPRSTGMLSKTSARMRSIVSGSVVHESRLSAASETSRISSPVPSAMPHGRR